MSGAIYMSAAGALNHQRRLEILANNLANINTVGFKEDRTSFKECFLKSEALNQNTATASARESAFIPICSGTKSDFSGGRIQQTGNYLDMAIEGDGFFCIRTADGVQYTRKGNFTLDQDGVLVTAEGQPVLGEGGEIRIGDMEDSNRFEMDDDGRIIVDEKTVGALKIVDFTKPYNLKKINNTMFVVDGPGTDEIEAEGVKIYQGCLELSNVNSIRAMTDMIETLRGYESYQKMIKSIDDVTGKAINDIGRLT